MSEGFSLVRRLALSLALTAPLLCSIPAEGSISYSGSLGINEQDSGRLLQTSTQRVSANATQLLTEKITTEESLLYTTQWSQGYDTVAGQRTGAFSPSLNLQVQNDLFNLGFSWSAIETVYERNVAATDSENYELTWLSKWKKRYVPQIDFSLTQRNTLNDSNFSPAKTERQQGNLSMDWKLGLANLFYNYRWQGQNDVIRQNEDIGTNQLARLSMGRSLFNKRLRIAFSQSLTENTIESSQQFLGTGAVRVSRVIPIAYAGVDASPGDSVDTLPTNTAINNNDTLVSAYTATANTPDHNIIIRVDSVLVDRIYVYTDVNLDLSGNSAGINGWELWTNSVINTSGIPWTDETNGPSPLATISVNYEAANRRYVILIDTDSTTPGVDDPVQKNFLKLHFNNTLLGTDVEITEIDASMQLTGTPGTTQVTEDKSKRSNTVFNVHHKVNDNFGMKYLVALRSGNDFSGSKTDSFAYAVTLKYDNNLSGITSTIDFSESTREQSGVGEPSESLYRAFGFDLGKIFLPTLYGSTSGSHSESYLESNKITESNRLDFSLDAQLYPDLSSNLNGRYTITKPGSGQKSENIRADISMTSRLKPSLSMTVSETLEERISAGVKSRSNSGSITMDWQPSDIFFYNAGISYEERSREKEIVALNSFLALTVGYRMQIDMSYIISSQNSVDQRGTVNWRWTIGRRLFWRTGVTYRQDEGVPGNQFVFFGRLSFGFSTD